MRNINYKTKSRFARIKPFKRFGYPLQQCMGRNKDRLVKQSGQTGDNVIIWTRLREQFEQLKAGLLDIEKRVKHKEQTRWTRVDI
jgi:hypothetical protein